MRNFFIPLWFSIATVLLLCSYSPVRAEESPEAGMLKFIPKPGAKPAHAILTVQVPDNLRKVTDTCKGYPLKHVQAIAALSDRGDNKTRWVITGSKNWAGWMAVIEAEGAPPKSDAPTRVIWSTYFDKNNPAGPYNHPGDVQIVGNTLVVALQNWAGAPGFPKYCPLHRPDDSGPDAVGFYDLGSPNNPRYMGKMTSTQLFGQAQELSDLVLFPAAGSDGPVNVLMVGPGSKYFYSTGLKPDISSWKKTQLSGPGISAGGGSYLGRDQMSLTARVFLEKSTPTVTFNETAFDKEVDWRSIPQSNVTFHTTSINNCGYYIPARFLGLLPEKRTVLGPYVSVNGGRPMISCVGPYGGPFKLEILAY